MDPLWVLSFPENVAVSTDGDGELALLGAHSRFVLRQLAPGLRDALRRLVAPGETAGRLAESVRSGAGTDGLARWHYHLRQLAQRGLLHLSANEDGKCLATLVPIAVGFTLAPVVPLSLRPYVLSRFAFMRRAGDALLLESPLSCARIILHDSRAAALVHALARPVTAAELGAESTARLLALLVKAGMVCEVGDGGTTGEDADSALRSWEFHDLLFHARSREGRHDAPVGAIYPLAGERDPPPALKPADPQAETIDLYRPNLELLVRQDPPFARVQEQRHSLRNYAAEPITERQLGEFLYRVARVKECQEMEVMTPHGPRKMAFALRPYPAGGALYELEMYAVVHACHGLSAGLYHYDALNHRLSRIAERTAEVERLLSGAALAAALAPEQLQVLLILTMRRPRIAWKYASLAYALTLKHVGVLYQTMYLTATAMGLAPCALGAGDSDLFARAAGVDYYAETSVGEFLLGSKPAG